MNKKYSINEVAQVFNITTNKLRFYEKKGLVKAYRDNTNNYRYYTKEHLVRIQTILMYRVLGFSIEDIEHILNKNYKDNVLEHFYKQWEILNNEMDRVRLLKDSIEELMDEMYESDDKEYIDKIIESVKKIHQVRCIKDNWKDRWNFNDWAKTYDISIRKNIGSLKIYKNYDKILQTVYEKSVKNIDKDINRIKVLDIGVGTGNLSEKYLNKGYNIIGIDQSREMLNVAKQKFPNLKVRLGEFLKIPFNNNQFDVIVSTYAFHHLNDMEKNLAIKEMVRVLKDDGRIVIGDLMFENDVKKENLINEFTNEQIEEIRDEYYSDIEKLETEFNKYNKRLVKNKIDKLNFVISIDNKK
ncbi:methyltransferase domain-containing protein [Clostridium aestuarii]|uniref:Methyltransferase domain-containing protein n=1 Tax=Clostridium aestuarii TaxID=338193 RepID=A0ABT4CWR2_9CLOT|nr:methyltransferase domain-containing protein [Clostridium aestuarii]MCY6483437.1 methyltransferase domain-containing protein [Clostridium aestuarii]